MTWQSMYGRIDRVEILKMGRQRGKYIEVQVPWIRREKHLHKLYVTIHMFRVVNT